MTDTPPVSAFVWSRAHSPRSARSQSGDFVTALHSPRPCDAGGIWSAASQMPLWLAAERRRGRSTLPEIQIAPSNPAIWSPRPHWACPSGAVIGNYSSGQPHPLAPTPSLRGRGQGEGAPAIQGPTLTLPSPWKGEGWRGGWGVRDALGSCQSFAPPTQGPALSEAEGSAGAAPVPMGALSCTPFSVVQYLGFESAVSGPSGTRAGRGQSPGADAAPRRQGPTCPLCFLASGGRRGH